MAAHTHSSAYLSSATQLHVLFESLTLLGIGGFLVTLYFIQALAFYIRPDYFIFTLATGSFIIVVGAVGLVSFFGGVLRKNIEWDWRVSLREFANGFLLIFLLVCCLLLPRKSLSSQAASRRGIGQNILTSSSGFQPTLQTNFTQENPLFLSTNSNKFTIVDWARSFSINPEPEDYRDKSVSVDGFVQPSSDGTFTVSR